MKKSFKDIRNYNIGALFGGIGGIELGFKKAGFPISWANEIDKNASITYRLNHSHKLYEKDLKELDTKEVEQVEILTGGFPCQAFSIAGYQKGFEDKRGNIFFEILRFIDDLAPSVVFLENVKNLQAHDKGRTYERIKTELENRGYFITSQVLNSADYGNIPQNRERIYIVGFKDKQAYKKFRFPKPQKLTIKITDLIDKKVDEAFYYHQSKYYPQLKEAMKNPSTIYQWRRVYVRENKNNLCPTLTANMGTGGHNVPLVIDSVGIRKLTPRECARFQGFDEAFILSEKLANSHLYKQIGNSVTIPVIEAIAKEIRKALDV
ncbi:DNA cytosine methyltransferase [Helicobacter sp. 11S02596-1]|uniref:DNA cytosine methyltransferase n=1 Tax=Helicobacter sp. 11S02596-1 TaxID=1476194 RepID=UPI000BA52809|nr:DNA cytosine methyltransferase [Helicobacter sp. 11S02596-1]PAF41911.1 DNA (cytosine-5-)-methyltransferase [Helicobacter sp. 11S02596-1]